nr:MAG TPA: hypothetical protein [Caudoviricetes sp.]
MDVETSLDGVVLVEITISMKKTGLVALNWLT